MILRVFLWTTALFALVSAMLNGWSLWVGLPLGFWSLVWTVLGPVLVAVECARDLLGERVEDV